MGLNSDYMWDFEEFKDSVALIEDNGTELTYGQLKDISDYISSYIDGRKLVFVMCRNTAGCLAGYVSFLNEHIVPVMLSAELHDNLVLDLIHIYKPAYIWAPSDAIERFSDVNIEYETLGYCLLKTNYREGFSLYKELALLLTTSGSTGSPKFVRQSYENIRANAESIVSYLELDNTERPITTLPMNYTYGLSIINSHLMVGATILLTEKGLMQKEFWTFFKDKEATSFGGVPYTYEMLNKLRFFNMKLPSLRSMTQAGGKLLPELHEKFAIFAKENGIKFFIMYGQCEATARMGYLPYEDAIKKKGSMGIAIPGGTFNLIDEEGNIISNPDVVGELVYRGANVTLGYAEKGEDLIRDDERKGLLETGDMAKFDSDGYYYIVGRKKRFLKIYGNRVNLDEMERSIKGEFQSECAVAGTDDHMMIFVTDKLIKDAARNYAVNLTKLNPAAFRVVVVPEIPKNDAGKTLYKELEKYYDF